jgi:hypothetical protein
MALPLQNQGTKVGERDAGLTTRNYGGVGVSDPLRLSMRGRTAQRCIGPIVGLLRLSCRQLHPLAVAIGHLQRSDLANRRQVLPSADRMAESGLATTDRYMAFRKPSTMTKVLDEVLAANGAYAAEFGYKGSLPLPPARRKRSRF